MTTAFCETLNSAEQRRLASKGERFESLARQVADDLPLDPDDVLDELNRIGKTAEDLANAAEAILQRRKDAAFVEREPDLISEHNRLYTEQQATNAEFVVVQAEAIASLKAKYGARLEAIQQRLAIVDAERVKAQMARNRLVTTSPNRDRLTKLSDELATLRIALQERLPRQQRQAKPGDAGYYQTEIARTQAAADQLAAEIAQLEREALQP